MRERLIELEYELQIYVMQKDIVEIKHNITMYYFIKKS